MPTAPEVFVALRLRGAFDLRNVNDRIGLAASEIRVEGELVGTGRSGRRHKHSGWFLSSDGEVDADTIEPHLQWLLDQIEPIAPDLAEILASDDVLGNVDGFWASSGTGGGPWISAEVMSRLGALGLSLVVSFYATSSDDR